MNTPEHQIKVCPYDGVGCFAGCTCGWTGTVHGRKLDAREDGRSHQMMYAWDKPRIERFWTASRKTILTIWNQAVAVLRQDDYKVTQSSRNYATALAGVGLGSPADEIDNISPSCDCDYCVVHRGHLVEQEYERLDAYRNYRDESLRGGGAW